MNAMRWVELPGRSSILKLCRHRLAAGDRIGEHRHDFHEIFWVTGGEGEHRVNGESVPVSRGDLVWIRPFDCHGLQGRGRETLELYNLAFDPAVIGELGRRYPEVGRFFAPGDRQPLTMTLSERLLNFLESGAAGLRQRPNARFELDRFLLNLIAELAGWRANPYRNCPRWLREAAAELQRNPEHLKLGSRALALLAGRTPEHTSRELKRCAGITPSQAANGAREDYAARLLADSELNVTEIAYRCGFGTLSGFFPVFRSEFGCSPLEYRRGHLRSELQSDAVER